MLCVEFRQVLLVLSIRLGGFVFRHFDMVFLFRSGSFGLIRLLLFCRNILPALPYSFGNSREGQILGF